MTNEVIYCPHCNRKITFKKLLNRKEIDVDVWQYFFQGIYCPYDNCKQWIELDEEYNVINTIKKGDKNMKSFEKFAEEVKRLEEEYGVKIQFTLSVNDVVSKGVEVPEEPKEEPKEGAPKKKRAAKKEEPAPEPEPVEEKPAKKEYISDESLDEIEDKANEIFDEDEDQVNEFYDHMLKQFGVENEADLYEEDKDEVMEMLKFLEDNPDAAITDAKRYGKAKKSRRK